MHPGRAFGGVFSVLFDVVLLMVLLTMLSTVLLTVILVAGIVCVVGQHPPSLFTPVYDGSQIGAAAIRNRPSGG